MPAAIKICGLTDEDAIRSINRDKVDFAGFVYFPQSPRHIPLLQAAALKSILDPGIRTVSVMVDPQDTLLDECYATLGPHYLQLHGKETPERLAEIRKRFAGTKIIKAFSIRSADDVTRAMHFSGTADMLLFDAKPPEMAGMLPGGNGLSFDWALLRNREFPLPWMLSGGLNEANVAEAIHASGAKAVDVSSGVESRPGVKDPSLIHAFVKAARSA